MLKILQGRLQKYVNEELPDIKAGFRKVRGTRGQIANMKVKVESEKVGLKLNNQKTKIMASGRVWDAWDCAVVWAFFGNAFLWDCNEN